MKEPSPDEYIFISNLTETVLRNLNNENFGVKDPAREVNMSHYGLSRKLHLIRGEKVNRFIHVTRLEKAMQLLHGTPDEFNTTF